MECAQIGSLVPKLESWIVPKLEAWIVPKLEAWDLEAIGARSGGPSSELASRGLPSARPSSDVTNLRIRARGSTSARVSPPLRLQPVYPRIPDHTTLLPLYPLLRRCICIPCCACLRPPRCVSTGSVVLRLAEMAKIVLKGASDNARAHSMKLLKHDDESNLSRESHGFVGSGAPHLRRPVCTSPI